MSLYSQYGVFGATEDLPDLITFEHNGEHLEAAVGLPTRRPGPDYMVCMVDGVEYQISVALVAIPGYPGIGFVAQPIDDGNAA